MYIFQLLFIANDITFLERIKKPYVEFICCFTNTYNSNYHVNNSLHQPNLYNKGLLFNYNRIIGPSLLHLFLPLPINKKYSKRTLN